MQQCNINFMHWLNNFCTAKKYIPQSKYDKSKKVHGDWPGKRFSNESKIFLSFSVRDICQ